MDRIRVVIAEDESAVRDAMADLVASDPSIEVVVTACDAQEAIVGVEPRPGSGSVFLFSFPAFAEPGDE